MAKRIISGIGIFGVLILAVVFMNTPVLPVLIAIISGMAVYELNKVSGVKLPAKILSIAMAAFIPLGSYFDILNPYAGESALRMPILIAYIIAMLCMMVKWHGELKFEQAAISVFSSIAVPYSLGCWIEIVKTQESYMAYYLVLFAFSCSWLSDVFAYFSGVAFGKHKMTPIVSPKKTWEGAIGGILITAGVNVAYTFIYQNHFAGGHELLWSWYVVIPVSIALSVISIMGDLSASVIKRQFGVKDYSNLIPGHGGIMDRFDSVLFVFPVLYAVVSILTK